MTNQERSEKRFGEILKQIHDKLCRINIYFMKENHDHPMYSKNWGNVGSLSKVNNDLGEIMEFLNIDPNAKSY
jgi:hypothetical protein